MDARFFIFLLIASIWSSPIKARPDLLKQQRYEFQEFHTSSTQDRIASFPENATLEDAPVLVQHEPILWSHQHPNEVNAFAEMFRQSYNQMIERNNQMMPYYASLHPFIPVTYELYHIPKEILLGNYFGNQQQYVKYQTEQMSRKLIKDLEEGRVLPQELMNPDFFISHAAGELDRVHQVRHEFDTNDMQVAASIGEIHQQHQFNTFNAQQQQHQTFAESMNHQESERTDQILMYNHETGEFHYGTIMKTPEVRPNEDLANARINSANVQNPLNIQLPPTVRYDEELSSIFNQEVENIEIHTPVSVETTRLAQQHIDERVKSTLKPPETTDNEFYGSTYDQQPMYDLQFLESVSSTTKPSIVNVMSLVRTKAKVKTSTTTTEPLTSTSTTTTSTTTKLPTTESSIMSMLPNKKPTFNYTDIYQQVRAELDRQMKQIADDQKEETHFMGMTSNSDHVKLSYETVVDKKDYGETRGDQPVEIEDYNAEEYVDSETGSLVISEPGVVVLTTSAKPSSTLSPVSSTAKPNRGHQNPFYSAPLAPFPTTTIKPSNPYYSASLAPFPGDVYQRPHITAQSQIVQSELFDMNQETQIIDQPNGSHFNEADFHDQQYHDAILEHSELQISHDMQHYESVQQRYVDIGGGPKAEEQQYEKQLPPEQLYRNPDLQHPHNSLVQESAFPGYVMEITETPILVDNKTQKHSWFQRQFSKLKHMF